jgi:hypothetical protein
MVSLLKVPARLGAALFATGLLVAAGASVARPGTVNYAEGSVTLAGQSIGARQIGQAEVEEGQVLATTHGKAEMLLTPGVLMRLGDNSAVKMVSPSLTDTRVELLHGEAMIEAAQVRDENRIDVIDGGYDVRIQKHGIYRFDADRPTVAVFDGKAKVLTDDNKGIEVGKGKQLALGTDAKPRSFDREQTDDLYAWSKLRSGYLADANLAAVQTVVVGGPGWYGSGWYWSPWYRTWAFVPGDGYLVSPFGFGFYSPSYWYSVGPIYGYPYRGYAYRGVPYRTFVPPAHGGVFRGAPAVGGGRVVGGGARALGRGARM